MRNPYKKEETKYNNETAFVDFDHRLMKEFGRYGGIFMSFFVHCLSEHESSGICVSITTLERLYFVYWNYNSIKYTLENLQNWEVIKIKAQEEDLLEITLNPNFIIKDEYLEKSSGISYCLSCDKSVFQCICKI